MNESAAWWVSAVLLPRSHVLHRLCERLDDSVRIISNEQATTPRLDGLLPAAPEFSLLVRAKVAQIFSLDLASPLHQKSIHQKLDRNAECEPEEPQTLRNAELTLKMTHPGH